MALHTRFKFILIVAFLGLSASTVADELESKDLSPVPEPTEFVSNHSALFNGVKLNYQVRAGETYLTTLEGEPKASIFSFDYIKRDVSNKKDRPVTFVWNGGPGSASVWLHMGTYGPKRVVVPSDAQHPGSAPYEIKSADDTILDVTDLVFIDPVGTGYSRALGEHDKKEFWGLTEDANSMAEFIRDWVTKNGRWNSPKFILGESFGTTRAAYVAHILQDQHDMSLNGLLFVSQALDYAGSSPYVNDNLVSFITYLPTMAAAALYHNKVTPVPTDREAFLQDARVFASNDLLPALFNGNTLDEATKTHVRDRLAYFTGLSKEYIERVNLRVNGFRFAKELLRDEGVAIGLLDARYSLDEMDDVNADVAQDAANVSISAAYKAAVMSYMHDDLGIDWDRHYLAPADPELSGAWRWNPLPEGTSWEPKYVNTAGELAKTLRVNPSLKVLVASGIYDLVTPFFDAEYTLNRHGIERGRIEYTYYDGGHMMYVNEPSRVQLLEDSRRFIKAQLR